MKKKMKFILPLLVISIALITTGTIAYLRQEITVPNKFKTMIYDVVIEEEFNNTWGTKKVIIKNNEETPVVIRVNYIENLKDENLIISNLINGEDAVTKNWTQEFRNNFTTNPNDGWYYYKKVLNPHEQVQILESISPAQEDVRMYNYTLSFNIEAIQATKNAVQTSWNKKIEITNNNVNWLEG